MLIAAFRAMVAGMVRSTEPGRDPKMASLADILLSYAASGSGTGPQRQQLPRHDAAAPWQRPSSGPPTPEHYEVSGWAPQSPPVGREWQVARKDFN